MTNRIAIWLAVLIAGLVALDLAMGWGGTLYFIRKCYAFLNWAIFWR